MAIIGDRWAFMIIRDIYLGVRQFEEFRRRSNITRGTLASRLKTLIDAGILYKNPYQSLPTRYEYRLTDKGIDLYPVLLMTWMWEMNWGRGWNLLPELTHSKCGQKMSPLLRCSDCHIDIKLNDVSFTITAVSQKSRQISPRYQRRSKVNELPGHADEGQNFTMLDIVGDRWTSLVIAAAFFGLARFDEISEGIGIATNILSDRLKLLVRIGVFERVPYQKRPLRYEYRLSQMGKDLYAHSVTIHEWAERWLIPREEAALKLLHKPCDQYLFSEVVCSECDEVLLPREVTYERAMTQRRAAV